MTLIVFLGFLIFTTALATSPLIDDDSVVPVPKPVVSVPRKCPPNEVLKSRFACPPDTCDTQYLSYLCIANQTASVVCTCKDGYLRTNSSANGVCVPQDRCLPPECADDPNAVRGCGNRCKKTCADYNDNNKKCTNNVCNLYGCDCKEGYVFDENIKKCVRPKQCTKQCKKPHERYSSCLLGECVPKTCDDVGYPIACPSIAPPCAGGCICEEGYVRDCNGDCIDMKECPCCGGDPNAVSGCGNPCGKTCASLNANTSALICPLYCQYNGCDCKPGYRYPNSTETSKCIPERECPKPPKTCGANEEYYCGTSCPEATCTSPTPPICVNKKCKLGCFCKKGFVRDINNKCVPVAKCPPKCKGSHEIYIDCPAGQCNPKTCQDLITPPGCPRIRPPCPGGCVCEEGYLRDSKGICIKKEQCPQQCKGPHEIYIDCPAGQCNPKTCQDLITPPGCPRIRPPCPGGCVCEEGYLRDSKGICIKKEQCPQQCKGPHEIYIDCPAGQCNPKTCQDLITPPGCPRIRPPCPGGCVCEEGYLRDSKGICIKKEQCPQQCKGPYEIYIDCPAGQCNAKTCQDLITPAPCPGIIPPCPGGCVCEEGYLRVSNGTCIKKEQCPQFSCGANETYVRCSVKCPNLFCPKNAGPQPICDPPKDCPPGCVCKANYKYDQSGKCILASECPSVCKDPNASYIDCLDACPATCQNTKPNCVNIRCSPGCQCNKGYVLSKIGGKCVKVETCADYADCPANQTYVDCTFRCPQVICPDSDQTILCKPPRDCPGGCGCKPYYRYNATGDCVKSSDCPPFECTRPNEEFTSCHQPSDWERCDERYNSPPFVLDDPNDCTPKCICKKGFWRTDSNECVPEEECPPINP